MSECRLELNYDNNKRFCAECGRFALNLGSDARFLASPEMLHSQPHLGPSRGNMKDTSEPDHDYDRRNRIRQWHPAPSSFPCRSPGAGVAFLKGCLRRCEGQLVSNQRTSPGPVEPAHPSARSHHPEMPAPAPRIGDPLRLPQESRDSAQISGQYPFAQVGPSQWK